MEIYLTELDNESPRLVRLIMKSVYENDNAVSVISAASVSVSSICSKDCTPIMTCFISIPR